MKVHLLQKAIVSFLDHQLSTDAEDWYYPHSLINTFQEHWVPPTADTLGEVYDICLKSDYTQRWWKRDQYRPKEMMLHLMATDAEMTTLAWKDLYNSEADLEGRFGRFVFYCDDLLKRYRLGHPRSVDTDHYQDAAIISLYLAGRYPEHYALYPGLDIFQAFCRAIGSPDIPAVDDLVRYMKVAKVVYTFLRKEDRYKVLLNTRTSPKHKMEVYPFQLAYEVIRYEGNRFKKEGHEI